MKNLKKYLNNYASPDAPSVIAAALNKDRTFVLSHPEYQPDLKEKNKIRRFILRRRRGEPFAYIVGHKEFFGLNFVVNKNVLVPRPETELLVEEAIKEIKNLKNPLLIDVGTGSGCIPITIGKILKKQKIKIIATDISRSALFVAKKNARLHKIKIKFLHGDLLTPASKIFSLQSLIFSSVILTANLPYGWKEWKNNCSMETRGLKFEPPRALFTGKHGLELYEKLFKQIRTFSSNINCPMAVFCEFDPRQTDQLKKLTKKILPRANAEIKTDLCGRDRLLKITIGAIS